MKKKYDFGFEQLFYKGKALYIGKQKPLNSANLILRKIQPEPDKLFLDMRFKENREFLKRMK